MYPGGADAEREESGALRDGCPRTLLRPLSRLCAAGTHPPKGALLGEDSPLYHSVWYGHRRYVLLRALRIDADTHHADARQRDHASGGQRVPLGLSQLGQRASSQRKKSWKQSNINFSQPGLFNPWIGQRYEF